MICPISNSPLWYCQIQAVGIISNWPHARRRRRGSVSGRRRRNLTLMLLFNSVNLNVSLEHKLRIRHTSEYLMQQKIHVPNHRFAWELFAKRKEMELLGESLVRSGRERYRGWRGWFNVRSKHCWLTWLKSRSGVWSLHSYKGAGAAFIEKLWNWNTGNRALVTTWQDTEGGTKLHYIKDGWDALLSPQRLKICDYWKLNLMKHFLKKS